MPAATKVLVILPNSLFGFVESLPALTAIRRSHALAELWLIAEPELITIIRDSIPCERLIPVRDLTWSIGGLRHSLGLFNAKFSHVYHFNPSTRLHLLAAAAARGKRVYSIRKPQHPGFRALRLQDQLGELLTNSGLGDLAQPMLPSRSEAAIASLTVFMPDITEDTFTPQDWPGIMMFLEGMEKRGLDLQVLTVTDRDKVALGPLAMLNAVHADNFSDSARIFEESRLVLTTDQGSAALAAAYGVPTLILAPFGVDRLRTIPRGDHVGVVEYGYPVEIKSESLVRAALELFS